MAGGGGGAWKVAYADFVTAMMAFFMVMWLTSQKPELKEAVADYFKNPSGRQLTGNPNSSVLPSRNDSTGGRRSRAKGKDSSTTQNKMTDEGNQNNVGTIVKFEANSIALSEDAKKDLDNVLPELQGKPQRIEVRGHALSDSQQAGGISMDAMNISFQRALKAMEYLVSAGIEPNRIRLSLAGSSEPRYAGNEVDQSANARVEVYLLTEVYEAPSDKIQRMVSTKAAIAASDKEKIEPSEEPATGHGEAKPAKHGGH
ncbi:MAG: flagellar motor protein MotB [Pirellulaceae bacterium]|nr:flagellar motor protein MotB [Pirellulaceae bacterium]